MLPTRRILDLNCGSEVPYLPCQANELLSMSTPALWQNQASHLKSLMEVAS